MAKTLKCLLPVVILFLLGWSYRMPKHLSPGVYQLEERTTWSSLPQTAFKLVKDDMASVAPKDYAVAERLKKGGKTVFASFPLGNANQRVQYLALLDEKSKWQGLFVDINRDRVFDEQDQVLLSFEENVRGSRLKYTAEPLLIPVDYKTSAGRIIQKSLRVEIYLFSNPDSGFVETMHRVTSWFEGEVRFAPEKGLEYPVRLALVDLNGDGNFNNFSQDAIYLDLNYNGVFEKNERASFSSLFELGEKNRQKIQYRNYVFQWPYRFAVVPVSEWESASFYEPAGDRETLIKPANPEKPQEISDPEQSKEGESREVEK